MTVLILCLFKMEAYDYTDTLRVSNVQNCSHD